MQAVIPIPIPPGSTIGIIGGGQLGRMLAMAAAEMGYHVHIFCPDKDCPAAEVAAAFTCADYTDRAALTSFAQAVDVVTFEFENIPHESLMLLEQEVRVHPSAEALRITRNRVREKEFVRAQGILTADFAPIAAASD